MPARYGDTIAALISQRRLFVATTIGSVRTTGVEPTSRRGIDRTGYIAREHRAIQSSCRIGYRYRGQQRLGVGMTRRLKDLLCRPGLNKLAQVHHANLVRYLANNRQIMGDEHIAEGQRALKISQQVEDLGLNGHIKRRYRLVADQHLRASRQSPGDRQTLTLPAGKFVWPAPRGIGRKPHAFK